MMRRFHAPSRWTWLLSAAVAGLVVACDNGLSGVGTQQTWGFVTIAATKATDGSHHAQAEGLFFKGILSAVPNASFTVDTCADGALTIGNNLVGVTYLDAGAAVTTSFAGVPSTLDRTTTTEGIAYQPTNGTIPYTPGDSVVVTVPGVSGGYPSGTIRAKTAEAFTFSNVDVPAGTETIQLNWPTPQDPNSAIVVSLRYSTTANPGVLSRNVLCTFVDDGADSIPFRWHRPWSSSQGDRAVVVTRLRTNYVAAGEGNLGVISTYQVPTPPKP